MKNNRQLGFTLIEALVSTAVFAVSMMTMIGIYYSMQRLNQRSGAIYSITQNARFIHEDLVKLMANGAVDYARYSSGTVPQPSTTELLALDKDGVQTRLYRTGNTLYIEKNGNTAAITSSDVQVLDFRIYIAPSTNPFPVTGATPKEQPTIGIYLNLQANFGNGDEYVRQSFQTTIATRQYQ